MELLWLYHGNVIAKASLGSIPSITPHSAPRVHRQLSATFIPCFLQSPGARCWCCPSAGRAECSVGSPLKWAQQAGVESLHGSDLFLCLHNCDFQLCENPASSGHGIKPSSKVLVFAKPCVGHFPQPSTAQCLVGGGELLIE